jgi:hypothetical protein
MTSHGHLALLLSGLLLAGAAAGKAAPKRAEPVQRFVSEAALKNLECVTHWEQICATDPARHHQLEVQPSKVKYLAGSDSDVEYAVVGKSRKELQLATPGTRQAMATLKLDKDSAVYKGPDNGSARCKLPKCAEVPECVPPEDTTTVRFISETRLSQRLRELMSLVPKKQCPESKLEYTPALPGETCLNTGKPYTPSTAANRKRSSVRLDSQPLRLFLSNQERTLLDNEAQPLLDTLRAFYASRLAKAPKVHGTLTAHLHFPEGGRKPEISIQEDGPRDAKLTGCLSAALRSRELFPWRPAKVVDLELSFVFAP